MVSSNPGYRSMVSLSTRTQYPNPGLSPIDNPGSVKSCRTPRHDDYSS